MILTKLIKYIITILIIVLLLFSLFSLYLNKTKDYYFFSDVQTQLEKEDEKIAKFLVETTNINIQIIELSKDVKDNSNSIEVKNLFENQEASIFRIQSDISKISEEKLITLPIFSTVIIISNKKKVILKDTQFIDQLMNLLISEVKLFEKIKSNVNDQTILAFQEQYKPILEEHLEEVSSMKVQNYTNN